MLVRLVGGPCHNCFLDDEAGVVQGGGPDLPVGKFTYRRVRFRSGYGTSYEQYIHEDLIRGSRIHRSTYRERFARYVLPLRELNERLGRAMCIQNSNQPTGSSS